MFSVCSQDPDSPLIEETIPCEEEVVIRQDELVEFLNILDENNGPFHLYTVEQFIEINEQEKGREDLKDYQSNVAMENQVYNRYHNILPFDRNRIELQDKRLGENDYINASLIVAPYDIPRVYIAAQGPLSNTTVDFWRAVVEYSVPLIVCLTTESEQELGRCARYWPEGEEELRMENEEVIVLVKNIEENIDSEVDCVIRRIRVRFYRDGEVVEESQVDQLQFLDWPDHDLPEKPDKLLGLIKLAKNYYEDYEPVLVHCSAGCGRTGTFCVIDSVGSLIQRQLCLSDPIACLTDEFRKQRTTMVQTQGQFNFCYLALRQLLKEIDEEI